VTQNEAAGIVWGLGDAKRSCLLHLGIALHEMDTRRLVGDLPTC
jgi:hypothetical protein